MTTDENGTPKISYSIREACRASSISKTTLYSHIAAGRLRVHRVGGRTIIMDDNLRAFLTRDCIGEASHASAK